MTKGTVAEIRERTFKVLQRCGVEMLIIDEADRLKPKTFAEVRDIFDKLNIAVVFGGTLSRGKYQSFFRAVSARK